MKIVKTLDSSNYQKFISGENIVSVYNGLLLPINPKSNYPKFVGDVFLQFQVLMIAELGYELIDIPSSPFFEYIKKDSKKMIKFERFELNTFLNSLLLSDSTICYWTDKGIVQTFRSNIKIKIINYIKQTEKS